MVSLLDDLYKYANLEWHPIERCNRLLKWAEALTATLSCNLLAHFFRTAKFHSALEKHIRGLAAPTFGVHLSVLQAGCSLLDQEEFPAVHDLAKRHFKAADFPRLPGALSALSQLYSVSVLHRQNPGTLQLMDALLAVRNRGLAHGAISEEAVGPIEEVCGTLQKACDDSRKLRMLVVEEIRASESHPDEYVERGILYDGNRRERWEEKRNAEDLLPLRQLHSFDKDGQAIPAPPFIQVSDNSLWFLLKYRSEGDCQFTDFRSATPKKNHYWDKYLREFFEERFERAGRRLVQRSATGGYHNLPPQVELYPKFVGRVDDLRVLTDRLTPARQTHIVALSGVGGVGKTALAHHFTQSILVCCPGNTFT